MSPPRSTARSSPEAVDDGGGDGDSRRALLLLGAAGATEILLLWALAHWPGVPLPHPGFLLFGLAFAAYLLGAAVASRAAAARWVVWGAALLLRLALLAPAPELSDDVWRYLWDGHVQRSGVNPYRYAPTDPALDALDTPVRQLVNNPDVPTIYPPAAQLAFLLVALLGNTVLAAKLLWMAFDLATGWILGRIARATGRDPRPVLLLYLWSPLLVVETAWNGHLEPLGLLGLALLLALTARPTAAGVAGAWAALTKLAPAAALPPLVRRLGWRFLAGFVATGLLLYVPYLGAGSRVFAGLGAWARHWRFNEGAFALLEMVLPGPTAPRVAAGTLVLGVVAWATWRRWDPERSLLWILGAGFVLSPTVHPWYALWMLPLAALRRSPAWILFTGTVFVGYWGLPAFLESGEWPRPLWGRLVLWLPVAAALAWEALRDRADRDRPARRAPRTVPRPGGHGPPGPGPG